MVAKCILAGAIFGFLAVAAGAFGAHALRESLAARDMAIYQTAVSYQMYHALALVGYGAVARQLAAPAWPAIAFGVGVVIFSGSLYALVATGVRRWGMVTPVGGVALLIGWAGVAWTAIRAWRGGG